MICRAYHFVIGLLAALWLAHWVANLTYAPWLVLALGVPIAVLLLRQAAAWLLIMPGLWPIIDFVPGTGRMYMAESDALALLCIAALSLRAALRPSDTSPGVVRYGWAGALLLAAVACSYTISSIYALTPFPPLDENAFAGYGPFNALRLGKGFLWPLLLLPHWLSLRRSSAFADTALRIGMTAGLASASIAALWDRVAFNDLLDLATDYRTTGLFWEMHVGGAALDGWLMLTLPFAIAGLLQARKPFSICLHLLVLALAAYAVLTTFSRGVYLGCGVMLICVLPFWWRRRRADRVLTSNSAERVNSWLGPAMLMACSFAAVGVFHGGGYRGLGAMFAAGGVVYLAGGLLRPISFGTWLPVICVAGALGGLSYLLHDLFAKGAYWLFAAAWTSTLLSAYLAWRNPEPGPRILLAICASWCAAGTGWVCWHWGGDEALPAGLVASGMLFALLMMQTLNRRPLWVLTREAMATTLLAVVTMLMVAVGAGSYFIGTRFSTVNEDFNGRLQHWQHGIGLIQNAEEWALGIGVGRFPDRYYWHAPIDALPGIWRIGNDGDNMQLHLVGSRFPMGSNQLLRVSQRIGVNVQGPFVLRLRVRAPEAVTLMVEVCQKQLLYAGDCASAAFIDMPGGNVWTKAHQLMSDRPLVKSKWYAPRMVSFAIAIRNQGKSADIDDIELLDAEGNSLLKNGDFAHDSDNWFFSSDRIHLPYHAKSMAIHLLVEQGIFGLLAVGLAVVCAMVRLGFGRASTDPAAPVLLAALGGFLMVGVFDSLLDVPRDTAFFFLLVGAALLMHKRAGEAVQKP